MVDLLVERPAGPSLHELWYRRAEKVWFNLDILEL